MPLSDIAPSRGAKRKIHNLMSNNLVSVATFRECLSRCRHDWLLSFGQLEFVGFTKNANGGVTIEFTQKFTKDAAGHLVQRKDSTTPKEEFPHTKVCIVLDALIEHDDECMIDFGDLQFSRFKKRGHDLMTVEFYPHLYRDSQTLLLHETVSRTMTVDEVRERDWRFFGPKPI
jgi:hypothetical protein